ncbi:PadR family transcriptional regulator [Streptomyces massasporeus]
MSIRHGLLALLERGPRYGSQLRTEFESRTGSTWPLNVGQVYTTLNRLERDGMVAQGGEDAAGHALYAITDSGRAELRTWFEKPVDRTSPARDELAIKLAMAVGASGVDIRDVIQSQRRHTVKAMQDYTRLKAQALLAVESGGARERDDVAWLLVLDAGLPVHCSPAPPLRHLDRRGRAFGQARGGAGQAWPCPAWSGQVRSGQVRSAGCSGGRSGGPRRAGRGSGGRPGRCR